MKTYFVASMCDNDEHGVMDGLPCYLVLPEADLDKAVEKYHRARMLFDSDGEISDIRFDSGETHYFPTSIADYQEGDWPDEGEVAFIDIDPNVIEKYQGDKPRIYGEDLVCYDIGGFRWVARGKDNGVEVFTDSFHPETIHQLRTDADQTQTVEA